jgi:hypothetical protein
LLPFSESSKLNITWLWLGGAHAFAVFSDKRLYVHSTITHASHSLSSTPLFATQIKSSFFSYTWGCNSLGQLGLGHTAHRIAPVSLFEFLALILAEIRLSPVAASCLQWQSEVLP